MTPPQKRLFALTAGDLMSPAVLTLPEEMRRPAAGRLLRSQDVSGAPVVDPKGRCTGVLSTTDFMHWAEGNVSLSRDARPAGYGPEWEVIEPDDLPHDEVRDYMTADPVTVPPATPFARLAEMMLEAHIHRLIVVDPESHPVGVVTTTDVLAALVREARTTP